MPSMDARFTEPMPPLRPSPRLAGLGKACFFGDERPFVNALIPLAVNSAWDEAFDETGFLAAPEGPDALPGLRAGFNKAARRISVPKDFYRLSLAERRVWLLREALTEHAPLELLPGDLLAGARCNLMLSRCLSKAEAKSRGKLLGRKEGLLGALSGFHADGRGRAGLTGGRLVPDYPHLLAVGFNGVQAELKVQYDLLPKKEREGRRGTLIRCLMDACETPVLLARRYAALCAAQAESETDEARKEELLRMARNLDAVPAGPAQDFYQAVQSLWLAHLVLTAEENGGGAGLSLGRADQYLLPYWNKSIGKGMDRALGVELVGCLLLHCGSVRDAMAGWEGPDCAAGVGQTVTLSGLERDPAGTACIDQTNELTLVFLEAFAQLPGLTGVEPIVLLHRRSPDALIRRLAECVAARRDAGLRIRFVEPAPAPAGGDTLSGPLPDPLEAGANRCGAACIVQLGKAVELALTGGRGLDAEQDARRRRKRQNGPADGPDTGLVDSFEALYAAFRDQLAFLIQQAAGLSGRAAAIRGMFAPAPFAAVLTPGCGESAVNAADEGGGRFLSIQAAGLATAVDSLLAVDYLTYAQGVCNGETLTAALAADWYGYELLQAAARYRAPKYGGDDPAADALAARVAADFVELVEQLPQTASGARFRPCFDQEFADLRPPFATPDGRSKGDPASSGLSRAPQGEPVPATALANSAAGVRAAQGGAAAVSLPPWELSQGEAVARLKAFLMGAAARGVKELLLVPAEGAPAEGEPDYHCVPTGENESL